MTLDSGRHPISFALSSSLSRSSCARWFSKISCITVLGSAKTGTDSAAGFRRRRGRFLILAIGSGAGGGGGGAAAGCRVRRFRFGMPGRLTSGQEYSEPVNVSGCWLVYCRDGSNLHRPTITPLIYLW
jgi:hypothetical protein